MTNWEEQFDKQFVLTYPFNGIIKQDLKDADVINVKQFISDLLKERDEKIYTERAKTKGLIK